MILICRLDPSLVGLPVWLSLKIVDGGRKKRLVICRKRDGQGMRTREKANGAKNGHAKGLLCCWAAPIKRG